MMTKKAGIIREWLSVLGGGAGPRASPRATNLFHPRHTLWTSQLPSCLDEKEFKFYTFLCKYFFFMEPRINDINEVFVSYTVLYVRLVVRRLRNGRLKIKPQQTTSGASHLLGRNNLLLACLWMYLCCSEVDLYTMSLESISIRLLT